MKFPAISSLIKKKIENIGASSQPSYTKNDVIGILKNTLEGSSLSFAAMELSSLSRGDVFVSSLVGGKVRPWVVLSCRSGTVVAVALSSSGKSDDHASQCRMWPNNFLGTTVSVFEETYARETVVRPYTNKKHLREVEKSLAKKFGLRR